MKDILYTILLGIIQGLTEFLPISSSGHLTLMAEIFGITENNLFTTVALHFGTLCAVVVYYFKDILGLLKKENHKSIWYLILATLPAGVFMLCFNNSVEKLFNSSKFVSFGFLISAIILLLAETIGKKITRPSKITAKTALAMGLSQACAIFPGITRSGTTISGGLILANGKRKEIADFSFLMSIPIIIGSVIFELFAVDLTAINWLATALGVLVSFITGYFAIKFMLKIVGNCNFKWFSLYLFLLFLLTFFNGFVIPIW